MKARPFPSGPRRGYTLIELMVYVAVYALLLGLGFMCLYRCFDHFTTLRRNSDDITRATRAGEIWRRDIRGATAAIQLDADQALHIPQQYGETIYRFVDSQVYRQTSAGAPATVLLARVRASTMRPEARARVNAWRWEVELQTRKQPVRMLPVFTFLAVPLAASKP